MKYRILNFDDSALSTGMSNVVESCCWQEAIRFGCSWRIFRLLSDFLNNELSREPILANIGSGDFHHITYLLLDRLPKDKRYHLVILDNHPDNMLFPFGIHCGSWVYHAAKLPHISHVTVAGITSRDVHGFHLLENRWSPIVKGKITYLCGAPFEGLSTVAKSMFPDAFRENAVTPELANTILSIDPNPIYLSIDKDVLSKDEITTNWDQGLMTKDCLLSIVKDLKERVIAADLTGEISFYYYRSYWKRFLSKLDGQGEIQRSDLPRFQKEHQMLNEKIAQILK